MKIELHLHTSRHSPCAVDDPDTLMRRLVRCGYGAVYITEHERLWSCAEIRLLQENHPKLLIFPGVELSVGANAGTHLLVLGTTDQEYIWLQSDPAAVLQKAREQGHLTVLSHPFRWADGFDMLQAGLLPDALEYLSNNHTAANAAETLRSAQELGLRMVNAGDIHTVTTLDRFWIESEHPLEGPNDIRPIVLEGRYRLVPDIAAQNEPGP